MKQSIFNKLKLHIFSKIGFLLILLSVINLLTILIGNFGYSMPIENFCNNISICNVEQNTNKVRCELKTKENKNQYFFLNWSAVKAVSTKGKNNSVYFEYSQYSSDSFIVENFTPQSLFSYASFGISNASEGYVPLDLKIISGKYNSNDYDITQNVDFDSTLPIMISESFVKLYFGEEKYENVVGTKSKAFGNIQYEVKAIVSDKCLCTNYTNVPFVITNYRCLSSKLDGEILVMKLDRSKYATNFSIMNLAINWYLANPFAKTSHCELHVPKDEWAVSELKCMVNQNYNNKLSWIAITFPIISLALGLLTFFILKRQDFNITDKWIFFTMVLLSIGLTELLKIGINGVLLGNIHISSSAAIPVTITFFNMVLYVSSILVGFKRKRINNIYEINI